MHELKRCILSVKDLNFNNESTINESSSSSIILYFRDAMFLKCPEVTNVKCSNLTEVRKAETKSPLHEPKKNT